MDNQAIYLAKLYSLRENLYKNNLNTVEKKPRTSFESYLDSRHSKLFSDILANDMHNKPGRSVDMSKNTFKEFDGKIIPKTIINSKTQMKGLDESVFIKYRQDKKNMAFNKYNTEKQYNSIMRTIKNSSDSEISDTISEEAADENKFESILTTVSAIKKPNGGVSFADTPTEFKNSSSTQLPLPKFSYYGMNPTRSAVNSTNKINKHFYSSIDGIKLDDNKAKPAIQSAVNHHSINNMTNIFREIDLSNSVNNLVNLSNVGNFNLPKMIQLQSQATNPAVITNLNDIIHNENGKTINDQSIQRLRKLLNLDDFSTLKEKEKDTKKKEKHVQKGHKLKNSLTTINESCLPAHRTDYTQIVSKVMILKKLSNSKAKNSAHEAHAEPDHDDSGDMHEQRVADSSIMKIIITDRSSVPQCTPMQSPRTNFNQHDDYSMEDMMQMEAMNKN